MHSSLFLLDGGTANLLIQRGKEYANLASSVFLIAFLFNALAAGVLVGASGWAATFYDSPQLQVMLWILGCSVLLRAAVVLPRARLTIELQFVKLAKINSISMLCRYGSTVFFAITGFGPLSFVLPMVVSALYEWWACTTATRHLPAITIARQPKWRIMREILLNSRWIMLGALATSLVVNGDYLVLSTIIDQSTLGLYFFGFQLSIVLSTPLASGMQSVLLPLFSRLSLEPERQVRGYLHALSIVFSAMAPICALTALLCPVVIHLLWLGKWDDASPVAQLMFLSLVMRLVSPLNRSLIEARGKWGTQSIILCIDALGVMTATFIGATHGGLLSIALFVSIYHYLQGLFQLVVASRILKIQLSQVLGNSIPILLASFTCAVIAFLVSFYLLDLDIMLNYVIAAFLYLLLYSILAILLLQKPYRQLYTFVRLRTKFSG